MRNFHRRLGKIEELLSARACICGDHDQIEFVIVESGSSSERVRALEDEKAFTCPVHGQRLPPLLHLSPSDVYG
jgi:hypothetical protein